MGGVGCTVRWRRQARGESSGCIHGGREGDPGGWGQPMGVPSLQNGEPSSSRLPPLLHHQLQGGAETFAFLRGEHRRLQPHTPPLPNTQPAAAGPEPTLDADAWPPLPGAGSSARPCSLGHARPHRPPVCLPCGPWSREGSPPVRPDKTGRRSFWAEQTASCPLRMPPAWSYFVLQLWGSPP